MTEVIEDFFQFLIESPTAWHATSQIATRLIDQDFIHLKEEEKWHLQLGKKYFVERGGALIAFCLPSHLPTSSIICATHTDSPCLKIKPQSEFRSHNMNLLRVEAYGGPQLSTWYDRDLAIAGQVYVEEDGNIKKHLVYAKDHPFSIPSLAIHLQEKHESTPKQYIDKQEHLCPLVSLSEKEKDSLHKILSSYLHYEKLLGADLYLVPIQPPAFLGISKELIAAYRLDNLTSAHATLTGFLNVSKPSKSAIHITAFWNNEETGSQSNEGAGSPFLEDILKRICFCLKMDEEDFIRLKSTSLCLSIDVGHTFHPNFAKRYDTTNHPLFNHGILIKQHANLSYASTAQSVAAITHLCEHHKIPFQHSVNHSEIRSGSTVGPIMATTLGIATVDIGPALLAMHSTRELMATKDHLTLCKFVELIFETLHR